MNWIKVKPLERNEVHHGCLTCSHVSTRCSLSRVLDVGFGEVIVTRDDETVYRYSGHPSDKPPVTLRKFENKAKHDPDHDWRVEFNSPLHGEVYQRHADKEWALIESNEGFA